MKAVASQHPAVVLRSHYQAVRALLAVAMIAVVGLTAAVVILATEDETAGSGTTATRTIDVSGFESRPDEGSVAASISRPAPAATGANETDEPGPITFRRRLPGPNEERPDESAVAGAISGR